MKPQKQTGAVWIDETGTAIPANRITRTERLRERKAYDLATEALKIHDRLREFKTIVAQACEEVVESVKAENGIKSDGKGNYTWFNFDRSIKIEISVNDMIKFDDILIEGAKGILLSMIDAHIKGEDFIKTIVLDAFQTTKGKLDTSRVLGLKRHGTRIKSEEIRAEWNKAMDMIDRATTRPSSRRYFRIWLRRPDGEYEAIDLNFSSI